MVWKILSILSAGCLAGACYFANDNKQRVQSEKTRSEAADANLKLAQERKVEFDGALKTQEEQYAESTKERDAAKEEVVKLAATAAEKDAALTVLKGTLEEVSKQVAAVEKQIEDAGDIESLVAQIEKLKQEQTDAQSAVATQSQRIASAKAAHAALVEQTNKLRDAEIQGRRGVVAAEFNARVAQYFPEWNFAILNKGNSQGVFANADLEIKRGQKVIARLKVRNVEQNTSVADVLPGSLVEGEMVRNGDVVVAAAKQSAADTKPSSPGTGGGEAGSGNAPQAPAEAPAPPQMGSDPFGAPPAAPMNSDPFGAPPAAPAAPMNSDPFGAPPAAPMNSDPFGAPPAQ